MTHDVAKSVNVLKKRLEPRRKRWCPYVFTMNSTMTPHDEVGAFCVHNLLKAHHIKLKIKVDGTSKNVMIGNGCNECVVHFMLSVQLKDLLYLMCAKKDQVEIKLLYYNDKFLTIEIQF